MGEKTELKNYALKVNLVGNKVSDLIAALQQLDPDLYILEQQVEVISCSNDGRYVVIR